MELCAAGHGDDRESKLAVSSRFSVFLGFRCQLDRKK